MHPHRGLLAKHVARFASSSGWEHGHTLQVRPQLREVMELAEKAVLKFKLGYPVSWVFNSDHTSDFIPQESKKDQLDTVPALQAEMC